MIKKLLIILILIGALIGGYVYFFIINKSHPDYENMNADLKITAEELYNECRNGNALKFTGKLLEVKGKPTNIEINDTLYTLVYVFDEGMFGPKGVRATLLKSYNKLVKDLDLNKTMIIKAYCTGYNDTDVILEKTSIVKP